MRSWRTASGQVYGAEFAADLRAAGVAADASQVSRWESGARAPSLAVVAAYERLTEAPPGSIQAAMLGAARLPGAVVAGPSVALEGVDFDVERLPDLLDALLTETSTGADWLRLGCQVASYPERFTMRRSTWHGLTTRLVEQVGRSFGNAWSTRYEAALLLARHPHGQSALVESFAALVDEPGSPMAVDHISLLQDAVGPEVNGLALRLLDAPPGPVFSGALWVCGAKIARGHLSGPELEQFEMRILRLISDRQGTSGNPFVELADVLVNLPEESRRRLARRSPQLARLFARQASPPTRSSAMRYGSATKEAARGFGDDPLFTRLVDEALSHPDNERRHQSCITLLASPWRKPLSDNVCRLIDDHLPDRAGAAVVTRLGLLMSFVNTGCPENDAVLARLAQTDFPAAPFAIFASAHSPATVSLLDPLALLTPAPAQSPSSPGLYYAGMRGHPALSTIATDTAFPASVRSAARWWQQAGPAIHEG